MPRTTTIMIFTRQELNLHAATISALPTRSKATFISCIPKAKLTARIVARGKHLSP
jgi:hypothetical protein